MGTLTPALGRLAGGLAAGFAWTLALGLPALYLLGGTGLLGPPLPGQAMVSGWYGFAWSNLHWSLVPFAAVLALYVRAMVRLRRELRQWDPDLGRVAHCEHLLDVATGLFFGVGVVWTAIGMESALINALSDPDEIARGGAFELLQRLVDGGILLALSTTVVGGIGGYLLRLYKTLTVAARLQALYNRSAQAPAAAIIEHLSAIEALLRERQPPPVASDPFG